MRLTQISTGIALMLLRFLNPPLSAGELICAQGVHPGQNTVDVMRSAKPVVGETTGTRHGLVLFARFRGENTGQEQLPDWADVIFDPERPGSFTHYYDAMSLGKLRVTGQVGPRWYESVRSASAYIAAGDANSLGRYGEFVVEILQQADAEVDFSRFDSDGPDGLPNSGDDDGVVDVLFVVMASTPAGFILRDAAATGTAGLGLAEDFITDDRGVRGDPIRIAPEQGTLQQGRSRAEAVGAMAHEFGHLLGLPDLYNVSFLGSDAAGPEEDSAGIGRWGLMGWGALGWSGDRPASLSAWGRLQLGWAQVVEPAGEQEEMRLEDVGLGGLIYRIPLNQREYFLLEHRRRTSSYYDRDIPGEGLLIWHVERILLSQESQSRVDLECADGRWSDAGFPLGTQPAAEEGKDNLDFWAHDAEYARLHGGNLGDATDPFDGERYTEFTPATNPSSTSTDRTRSVRIEKIRIEEGIARAQIRRASPQIEITELEPLSAHGGQVAVGMPVPVSFTLRNSGGSPATGLTAQLHTADPGVELFDAEVELTDLGMDEEKRGDQLVRQSFPTVLFSGAFTGEHTAAFVLEIRSRGQLLAAREFVLTARVPFRIAGRITSDAGTPLAGTSVVAIGSGDYRVRGSTDENGEYELAVLPGQYDLFIRPASGQRVASQRRRDIAVYEDRRFDLVLPLLYELSGTVFDAAGMPLGRVFVVGNRSIDGNVGEPFYVQTNGDGFYRLNLQNGTYRLRAIPSTGLRDTYAQQEMGLVTLDADRTLDVRLQRGAQVTVRVTDEEGRDVDGITVQLRGTENEFHPEVLTGVQGRVNVLPGVRTVVVVDPLPSQYVRPDSFRVTVRQDTTIRVVLTASFRVEGELLDAAGGRVDAQGLILFTPVGGIDRFEVQVEDGRYVAGVAAGEYRIQWQNFGHGLFPQQNLGRAEIDQGAVIDFVLEQGVDVRGRVVDDLDRFPDRGTLSFRSLESGHTTTAGVSGTGTYQVSLLKGRYRTAIHFLGSQFPDQDLGIVSVGEGTGLDFAVQRGEMLSGRIVDGEGEGLSGWSIAAYALDSSARGTVPSGADGGFELRLPPGRYRPVLSVRSGERATAWVLDDMEVPSAEELDFAAPQGAELSGRVVDGRGQLAAATVLLIRDPRELYNRTHTGFLAMVSTGGDGFYEIEAPAGTYTLIAYPQDRYGLGSVREIVLDSDRVVDLELPLAIDLSQLTGRLLDEQGNGIAGSLVQFFSEKQGCSGQVQTQEGGYYRIELPAGRYHATAGLYAGLGFVPTGELGEVDVGGGPHDLLMSRKETAVSVGNEPLPAGFSLGQNYPNPFNATTLIGYRLEQTAEVSLAVFNLAGQQVATLVDGARQAGVYAVGWDGRDDDGRKVASGVYLYRLQKDGGKQGVTRKLLLVK